MGFFQGTEEVFETAVVDEPSVFEPPKFYCIIKRSIKGALEKRAKHEKVFNISFDTYLIIVTFLPRDERKSLLGNR